MSLQCAAQVRQARSSAGKLIYFHAQDNIEQDYTMSSTTIAISACHHGSKRQALFEIYREPSWHPCTGSFSRLLTWPGEGPKTTSTTCPHGLKACISCSLVTLEGRLLTNSLQASAALAALASAARKTRQEETKQVRSSHQSPQLLSCALGMPGKKL